MSKAVIRILWAEDSISDILLIKEAFRQASVGLILNVVNNGVEAMDYLYHRGHFSRIRRPDIVILDLNMPKKSGREVIQEIKDDPSLHQLPVVVLTSSNADQNVLDGFDPTRCLYLIKPTSFQDLIDLAGQIRRFWLSLSPRPPLGEAGLNPKLEPER